MVMDYRERKPVSKNRPRKQPLSVFAVLITIAIMVSFGAGLATGWLVFRPKRSQLAVAQQQAAPGQPAPAQTAGQNQPAIPGAPTTGEPPLTFYETLPKGSRAVIGSGLNPHTPEPAVMAKPAVSPPPAPAQPQPAAAPQPVPSPPKASSVVKPPESKDKAEPPKQALPTKVPSPAQPSAGANKAASSKSTYSVQVASHKDRKEAEAVRDRLVARGMSAYIVESHLQDKGVWYRVRVGRGLGQEAANELAAKAGKGALTVPE